MIEFDLIETFFQLASDEGPARPEDIDFTLWSTVESVVFQWLIRTN